MPRPALEIIEGGRPADSRAALRELYAKYGASVFGRCKYLLRDPTLAEDAMQDVFAKALTHWSEFRGEASPLTWLMKIATRQCLNQLRADRAPWRRRFEELELTQPEAQDGARVYEVRDAIRKMLDRYDLETQLAAVHYYVDEMTLEEVAALLERSVPTIRKRLRELALNAGGKELP